MFGYRVKPDCRNRKATGKLLRRIISHPYKRRGGVPNAAGFCVPGMTRLSTTAPQPKSQATPQASAGPSRRLNGRFAKGYSGNPQGHKTFAANQALIRKHSADLLRALCAELGSKLTAVDAAFAEAACDMLAKAQISEKHRVHLTTKAGAIIERLRERYPGRKKAAPTLSLQEVLSRGR
jgi:hypothetical protein